MLNTNNRSCAVCETEFLAAKRNHYYCSVKCQQRARVLEARRYAVVLPPRPCVECSEHFYPLRENHRTCSEKCRRKRRRVELHPVKVPARACEQCDKVYQPYRNTGRFCSVSCRNSAGHRRATQRKKLKTCRSCHSQHERSQFSQQTWVCDDCLTWQRARYKRCGMCQSMLPFEVFTVSGASGRISNRCKDCVKKAHAERQLDPRALRLARSNRLKRAFGITADQFDAMLIDQGGRCASCGDDAGADRDMAVDHNHRCCPGGKTCGQCIRGILCRYCNQALGLLRDDPARAEAAARYLRRTSLTEIAA